MSKADFEAIAEKECTSAIRFLPSLRKTYNGERICLDFSYALYLWLPVSHYDTMDCAIGSTREDPPSLLTRSILQVYLYLIAMTNGIPYHPMYDQETGELVTENDAGVSTVVRYPALDCMMIDVPVNSEAARPQRAGYLLVTFFQGAPLRFTADGRRLAQPAQAPPAEAKQANEEEKKEDAVVPFADEKMELVSKAMDAKDPGLVLYKLLANNMRVQKMQMGHGRAYNNSFSKSDIFRQLRAAHTLTPLELERMVKALNNNADNIDPYGCGFPCFNPASKYHPAQWFSEANARNAMRAAGVAPEYLDNRVFRRNAHRSVETTFPDRTYGVDLNRIRADELMLSYFPHVDPVLVLDQNLADAIGMLNVQEMERSELYRPLQQKTTHSLFRLLWIEQRKSMLKNTQNLNPVDWQKRNTEQKLQAITSFLQLFRPSSPLPDSLKAIAGWGRKHLAAHRTFGMKLPAPFSNLDLYANDLACEALLLDRCGVSNAHFMILLLLDTCLSCLRWLNEHPHILVLGHAMLSKSYMLDVCIMIMVANSIRQAHHTSRKANTGTSHTGSYAPIFWEEASGPLFGAGQSDQDASASEGPTIQKAKWTTNMLRTTTAARSSQGERTDDHSIEECNNNYIICSNMNVNQIPHSTLTRFLVFILKASKKRYGKADMNIGSLASTATDNYIIYEQLVQRKWRTRQFLFFCIAFLIDCKILQAVNLDAARPMIEQCLQRLSKIKGLERCADARTVNRIKSEIEIATIKDAINTIWFSPLSPNWAQREDDDFKPEVFLRVEPYLVASHSITFTQLCRVCQTFNRVDNDKFMLAFEKVVHRLAKVNSMSRQDARRAKIQERDRERKRKAKQRLEEEKQSRLEMSLQGPSIQKKNKRKKNVIPLGRDVIEGAARVEDQEDLADDPNYFCCELKVPYVPASTGELLYGGRDVNGINVTEMFERQLCGLIRSMDPNLDPIDIQTSVRMLMFQVSFGDKDSKNAIIYHPLDNEFFVLKDIFRTVSLETIIDTIKGVFCHAAARPATFLTGIAVPGCPYQSGHCIITPDPNNVLVVGSGSFIDPVVLDLTRKMLDPDEAENAPDHLMSEQEKALADCAYFVVDADIEALAVTIHMTRLRTCEALVQKHGCPNPFIHKRNEELRRIQGDDAVVYQDSFSFKDQESFDRWLTQNPHRARRNLSSIINVGVVPVPNGVAPAAAASVNAAPVLVPIDIDAEDELDYKHVDEDEYLVPSGELEERVEYAERVVYEDTMDIEEQLQPDVLPDDIPELDENREFNFVQSARLPLRRAPAVASLPFNQK